ncbi:hypothetical protein B0H11DRAFT_2230093 [Mycena galericulata]|nr:hypothetical protein B0H11DRAFT_2230093 [Mycena galericulata]
MRTTVEITQKQIYALWSDLNEGAWRLDDDQVKSAQKTSDVEIIPIRTEAGIHAIAFSLKDALDGWANKTEELAMDSTFTGRTNEAGYELHGFVDETKGQAMPFAFLLTTSTPEAAEGAKMRMLCDVLREASEIKRLGENKPPAPYDP